MSDTWKRIVAVIAAPRRCMDFTKPMETDLETYPCHMVALISTHAQNEAERYSNEMDRLIAQGFTGDELLAEMRRNFPIPRRRPWYVELWAQFYGA
jgi:hypothetical protein